jgi:hypothetical protein
LPDFGVPTTSGVEALAGDGGTTTGGGGGAGAVGVAEALPDVLDPTALVSTILNWYVVPFARPPTVVLVALPASGARVVHEVPSVLCCTVTALSAAPLAEPRLHERPTEPLPAVAVGVDAAIGNPAGVMVADGTDGEL